MENVQALPLSMNGPPEKVSNTWERAQVTRPNHAVNYDLAQHGHLEGTLGDSLTNHTPVHRFNSRTGKRLLYLIISILSSSRLLIPRRGRPVRTKAVHELHPLAYLDALRGYLAVIIFTGHTMSRDWKWIPDSILSVPWLQFPFRGGFASLDIFFWISGYAVTFRLVGLMQAKRSDQLLDSLASSVFRRYFRLFLPILPVTLVTVVAIKTGLAIPPENKVEMTAGNGFWFWMKDAAHIMNPFTHIIGYWDGHSGSELLDPLWSLSAEFRSSMIMFVFCTGTCRMSSHQRKLLIWLCVPVFICWQAQWAAMAFLGMWFAECRQQKRREQQSQLSLVALETARADNPPLVPSVPRLLDDNDSSEKQVVPEQEKIFETFSTFLKSLCDCSTGSEYIKDLSQRSRKPFLAILFLYSFIILKDPYSTQEKQIFPHNLLNRVVPDYWHAQMRMHLHLVIGSVMMLYPLDQLAMLQRPLLTPFSQYLGELSFGIYAMHFTVRWIVWEPRYVKWQSERYGDHAFDHFWVAFPGWLGMGIALLWAADLFRRLDMQVVKFCKQLELRIFE